MDSIALRQPEVTCGATVMLVVEWILFRNTAVAPSAPRNFPIWNLVNGYIVHLNNEPTLKSQINWILSGVEGCKNLIIRTLRLRSVSGFPLNCLFGVGSIMNVQPWDRIAFSGCLVWVWGQCQSLMQRTEKPCVFR